MEKEQIYIRYENRYNNAKTLQDIMKIDDKRVWDKRLTAEQQKALKGISDKRFYKLANAKWSKPIKPVSRLQGLFQAIFIGNR